MSRIERKTRETTIALDVKQGGGSSKIATGDAFLDHMVDTLARYAGLEIRLQASGDLRHHLVEDVAISLGVALRDEVPPTCARFGWSAVPMDDALVRAAVDVGGRPWYAGRLPSTLYEHFLQSLAVNLGATLHVEVARGRDKHHVVEAAVKATGLALRQALTRGDAVFSTKGAVELARAAPRAGARPARKARAGRAKKTAAKRVKKTAVKRTKKAAAKRGGGRSGR